MKSPIRNRAKFFKHVEQGLQQYFDQCDRHWGGILHLTVGVKVGQVGGIIKSESTLSYEGFTLHRVETILKYVLPRFVSRDSVPYAIAAVLDELRNCADEPEAEEEADKAPSDEEPQPKSRRARGRKKKTEVIDNSQFTIPQRSESNDKLA